MKSKHTVFCWLVVGVLTRPSDAAEPPALRLSMDDCIAIALAQSAAVIQGRSNIEAAAIQIGNARNAFLPSINASYGMSRSVSGPREGSFVDPATGEVTSTLGESTTSGSQSLGTSFSMNLYNRGNWTALASSKLGHKAAEMDLSTSQQQVVFEVKQGYFSLLQAIELMKVQAEQVRVSEESLRRAETLFEVRSVPLSDVLTERAALASARANLIDRENSVAVTGADLAFAMGLRTYAPIVPVEEEFAMVALALSYEEALALALEHRPDLRSQEFLLLQAEEDLRGTRYELLHPTVSMSTGYNWRLRADERYERTESSSDAQIFYDERRRFDTRAVVMGAMGLGAVAWSVKGADRGWMTSRRAWGWALCGGSAILLVKSWDFRQQGDDAYRRYQKASTPQEAERFLDRANSRDTQSQMSWMTAAAFALAGWQLLALGDEKPAQGVAVAPRLELGTGQVGIQLSLAWDSD